MFDVVVWNQFRSLNIWLGEDFMIGGEDFPMLEWSAVCGHSGTL
jgi:hypothetical protein